MNSIASLLKDVIVHYEGAELENGLPHGFGAATLVNGCHYDGEWDHGCMHGKGTLAFPDGVTYFGECMHNSITGKGIYTWVNGTYEGEVEEGLPHGIGRMTCKANGIEYVGEWVYGCRHGKGTLVIEHGNEKSIYKGDWVNDMRHGKGSMVYPSGNKYQGQWKEGKKNGVGKMEWYDKNEAYAGQWKNDKFHGQGEYTWFIEGLDESNSNGFTFLTQHNRYIGDFRKGHKEGFGRLVYADGSIYEGEFLQDKKHGKALYICERGELITGHFDHDKLVVSGTTQTVPMKNVQSGSLLDMLDKNHEENIVFYEHLNRKRKNCRDQKCFDNSCSNSRATTFQNSGK